MNIRQFIESKLAFLAIAISAIALFYPPAFTWMRPHIPLLLGIIMFAMGMTLEAADFKRVLKQPRFLVAGIAAQYAIMPLLGLLIGKALGMNAELIAGLVLLGSCPGGTASNVIAYLARANIGLSVSLTLASTLLAPLLTPWLTWLYAHAEVDVNVSKMMWDVMRIVLVPIILGVTMRTISGSKIKPLIGFFPLLSAGIILAVIACVVALNAGNIVNASLTVAIAVIIHNAAGLTLGYAIGAMLSGDKAIRRTLAIEVGMQNSGLALALALKSTGFGALAALPSALFSVWHNITGTALAARWSKDK